MNDQAFSKIWILVIILIFVAGGILSWQYFGAPKEKIKAPEETTEDETANWKTYTYVFEGRSYTIKYPKDWLLVPGSDAPLSSSSLIGIENKFVVEKEYICFGLGCFGPGIVISDETLYHIHTSLPINLLKEPYPTFESLIPDFLEREEMNIGENKLTKFVVSENYIIYLLYNPDENNPFFVTIGARLLPRVGSNNQLIEYTKMAEKILSTFKFNKISPEIKTGVFRVDYDNIAKIQKLVDQGDQLWRLNPEKAILILGLDYGFTEDDLKGMKWFSTSPTEGIIQYTVSHKDKNYRITMVQPVMGAEKIWTILRIFEDRNI